MATLSLGPGVRVVLVLTEELCCVAACVADAGMGNTPFTMAVLVGRARTTGGDEVEMTIEKSDFGRSGTRVVLYARVRGRLGSRLQEVVEMLGSTD